MHKSDKDVFSFTNNEQEYDFTLFKTENKCSLGHHYHLKQTLLYEEIYFINLWFNI